jgi:hypothetical protein
MMYFLKVKVYAKRFGYFEFFLAFFASIGFFSTCIELATFWLGEPWIGYLKKCGWIIILLGVALAFYRAWPKLSVQKKIVGTDSSIRVCLGDVFSSKATLVISATTTFDFDMTDDLISPKSLQGQYQLKYFSDSALLSEKISSGLSQMTAREELTLARKPRGNRFDYPRGEVVFIKSSERHAFFVGLATFNQHMRAKLEVDEFLNALPVMWNGIRDKGENDPIDLPLIGTGLSRMNSNRRKVLVDLVRSFVAATRDKGVTDLLTIYIHPDDFLLGEFTFSEIEKILEFTCGHIEAGLSLASGPNSSTPIGLSA